jgi:Tol biopolymer transport system component
MKLLAATLLVSAAVAVGAATAAAPPVARAPGLVVALGGWIHVDGERVARGDQPRWSPDRRRIAFVRSGSVYVVRADGLHARRLPSSGASSPSWSPDGGRIVFTGARDVFAVMVATGKLKRLTRTKQPWRGNHTPAYSPDGKTVAFSRSTDAFNNDIFLVRADGTKLRRLTRTHGSESRFGEEHGPAWSPDGRTIVFVSNRDGNWELYAIRPDGSGERRLTLTPGATEDGPRFSRDGTRFVYVRDGRVVVARADGRFVRDLGRGTAADWR